MQVASIFIAFVAVTRMVMAQSPSGYNYPSPFNPLAPGSAGDLGGVPGANVPGSQQPTPYAGSQPAYNNQQYSPSGPQGPAFNAVPTLTPAFNQPAFGQPAPSSLPPTGSHSSVPGIAGVASHSSAAFAPSSQSGFPSTAAPSSKGFESGFPSAHSGSHSTGHSGGHSTGSFAGTPSTFSGSSGFPGSSGDSGSSGSFGAPSFNNQAGPSPSGQSSFGGQANNFGSNGGGFDDGSYQGGDYSAIPGTAGADYPIYTEIPKTSFDCKQQQFPGYYADVEAQCQVFHICALNTTFNFLCPNGTIFSQEHLVCVWWNQFDCNTAPSLYGNNAYIYDYSKTGQSQDSSSGFGTRNNFGNAADGANNYDGAQGGSFGAGSSPSSGSFASLPSSGSSFASSPSSGSSFGPSASGAPGFGSSHSSHSSHSSVPSFGASPSSSGFGSTPGFSSSPASGSVPSSGFAQPGSSHSSGFGQSHVPTGSSSHGSSHGSSHSVPSSHSFPAQQAGAEQYPIAPPSQTDYQSAGIVPTIPSSPAPFGVSGVPVTGYPAAGTPSPISTSLAGEQPSREYLPSRRTK